MVCEKVYDEQCVLEVSEKMDQNWNYDQENESVNKKSSLPGIILLAVVTAGVLGSLFFAFTDSQEIEVPSIEQLLETGEGGSDPVPVRENSRTIVKEMETVTGERVKGSLDISDVVQATMPSIVAITNQSVQVVESYFYGSYEIPSESAGSGIIIGENEEELLIATNYHVVEEADSITVCFSVEEELEEEAIVAAKIKGTDSTRDLAVVAVIKADIPESVNEQIKIAEMGNSEELVVGQQAIAIGNALGYGQSVTMGIVSALNRELAIEKTPQKFIQTDAAINFGNSGGALLNSTGQVIGINSAKAASDGVEGMGYAIPVNDAKPILEKLMSRKTRDKVEDIKRGSLGAELRNVSEEAQQLYDIPAGAFVYELDEDSVLIDAGLNQGDIITEFDGNRVGSVGELESLLAYYSVGETVELVYETSADGAYQEKTTTVTLQEERQPETPAYDPRQSYDPFDFWGDDFWSDGWWGF